jgi:hypothetical protein
MAIEFRKVTKKWGYRVYRAGRRYKKYASRKPPLNEVPPSGRRADARSGQKSRGQSGANLYHSFPQIADDMLNEKSELTAEIEREKSGGGEWSRTTDAADMSRVL